MDLNESLDTSCPSRTRMHKAVDFYVMRVLLCIASLVAALGCDRPAFDIAPVHGRVTVDGKPLTGGRVMFAPIPKGDSPNAGKPAFGTIQQDGSYQLTTYRNGDGAVVAEHWVTIYPRKNEALRGGAKSNDSGTDQLRKILIPQRQIVVSGQNNTVDLEISSKQIAGVVSKSGQ